MPVQTVETPKQPVAREQIEKELLADLRLAETEFKGASAETHQLAEMRFREALRRFSDFVLR